MGAWPSGGFVVTGGVVVYSVDTVAAKASKSAKSNVMVKLGAMSDVVSVVVGDPGLEL